MKTALILPPTAASFLKVAGLPLIHRTVLMVLRAEFDRVVVVGRQYAPQLRAWLHSDSRTRSLGSRVEVADDFPRLDDAPITVVASDRLITPEILAHARVVTLDGRPLLFGVGESHGVALCRAAVLAGIDVSALTAEGSETLWRALLANGAQEVSLDGAVCLPIGNAQSVADAEAALCARVRAASAASDGPLAYWIDRHISLRISRWLVAHTTLRPNHITIIGTSIGLLGAWLLSLGTYWAGVGGTLLFWFATIIDGCDGEVARLTLRESSFGQKFDVITDNIVHAAIFIGLALGLYRAHPDGHYLLLMGLLLGGFACNGALSYFFLVRRPGFATSGGPPISWKGKVRRAMLQGLEALMNRDFAYLLAVLALVNHLDWFVWGTAFGTYGFAFLLIWIYRWRDAS